MNKLQALLRGKYIVVFVIDSVSLFPNPNLLCKSLI